MRTISDRLSESTARQLLALMRHGAGRQPLWTDDDLSAILRYQLASPAIRFTAAAKETPPAVGPSGDQTLRLLLTAASPDIEQLKAVRASAKAARKRESGPLPGPVATVLYYTAIAAALVQGGRKITSLTNCKMREGFAWCASRPWMTDSLRATLVAAVAALEPQERKTP